MSETAVMVRHTPKEWIELFREAFAAGAILKWKEGQKPCSAHNVG
jgi:hypothetical protein